MPLAEILIRYLNLKPIVYQFAESPNLKVKPIQAVLDKKKAGQGRLERKKNNTVYSLDQEELSKGSSTGNTSADILCRFL